MSSPSSSAPSSPSIFAPSHPWPLDLPALVRFCLSDPSTQPWINSAANRFFAPSPAGEGGVEVKRTEEGCWALLPAEWQSYFEVVEDEEERMAVLKDLAMGERADFPPSLQDYLNRCRALSLDRTCSPAPVLSFPPPSPDQPSPPRPYEAGERENEFEEPVMEKVKGVNVQNAKRSGKSPKKEHEVRQLSRLVRQLQSEAPLTHCVDVGSGRAHLSRALACPPLNLHLLAIDWSDSQKTGAERLDLLRSAADLGPTSGSLTHEVASLDADGVEDALRRWPPKKEEEEGDEDGGEEDPPPALLVALHACGDLTPAALEAFVRADASDPRRAGRGAKAVFVGCCYNLLTPSRFPLSSLVRSLLPSTPGGGGEMTREHLRLTPQSPATWHLFPSSTSAFLSATRKIAFRARFEAELEAAHVGTPDTRRVGRIAEVRSWTEYRARAVAKWDYGRTVLEPGAVPALRFGRDKEEEEREWRTALWMMRVWWTLRSWLGPPMESLCVVDRFAYLCEGLRHEWEEDAEEEEEGGRKTRRRVEVVNVFDQAKDSPRNLALVVR
ncbi:hypothetical protein JCM8097_001136 [Rhodosporidiobolus ruineniae]